MTGLTRRSDNAFLYTEEDQKRMQEINAQLQKFNPGLVGSQVTSDHLSEGSGLTKGKLNQLPGNFDD
jgi:hypothetical protein